MQLFRSLQNNFHSCRKKLIKCFLNSFHRARSLKLSETIRTGTKLPSTSLSINKHVTFILINEGSSKIIARLVVRKEASKIILSNGNLVETQGRMKRASVSYDILSKLRTINLCHNSEHSRHQSRKKCFSLNKFAAVADELSTIYFTFMPPD